MPTEATDNPSPRLRLDDNASDVTTFKGSDGLNWVGEGGRVSNLALKQLASKRATPQRRRGAPMNRHERRALEAQERAHKRTTAARAHGHERKAFTINEFCWAHGISRATYYNLRERGLAPDEMRVLGKILITNEAAARWRKRAAATT